MKLIIRLCVISLIAAFTLTALPAQDSGDASDDSTKKDQPAADTSKTSSGDSKPSNSSSKNKNTEEYLADLKSNDPLLQITACKKLGGKKVTDAIPELIKLLDNSRDTEVQWNAAMSLGMIGKAGPATDTLLKHAKDNKSKVVRYAAIVGLANIQDKDKRDQIIEAMKWTQANSDDPMAKDLVNKFIGKYQK